MKMNKAIAKSLSFAVLIASFLLLDYIFFPPLLSQKIILIALFLLYSYPLIILFISLKKNLYFFIEILLLFFLLTIFTIFFQQIYANWPPAVINNSGIVGSVQYYGYPFYFDTIIFFIIALHPIITFILIKLIEQKRKKFRL